MIDFTNVSKIYPNNSVALRNVSLHIDRGEFVFVVGASGAGKSTFLKMIMREEVPTEGEIVIDGQELNKLKSKAIPYYRRKLGIVFQDFRLIPGKTVYENIAFAMHVIGAPRKEISRRVAYALCLVGLTHKAKSYPRELSGGEQQRTALARALVNDAEIIIADEPTGNIDPEMSKEIFDLLDQINLNKKTTVIMVTHDVNLARNYNKRIVTISEGSIVADTLHPEIERLAALKNPIEPPVQAKPSGFFDLPLSDPEIENFLSGYGNEDEQTENAVAGSNSGKDQ